MLNEVIVIMRILLVNDDGIEAQGIKSLYNVLSRFEDTEIFTYAPAYNNSGVSHSISVDKRVEVITIEDKKYAITGTPADCVIIALHTTFNIGKNDLPDLIISGMNHGVNVGSDVTCSGTIGAAIEGIISGIPSIAISQFHYKKEDANWNDTEDLVHSILSTILEKKLYSNEYLLNINIPRDVQNIKGIRIVHHGKHHGRFNTARRLNDHTFLMGDDLIKNPIPLIGDRDVESIRENYVTISPIGLDLTHEKAISTLESAF